MMKVTVSEGNTKLGKVLNISLPPVVTCPADAPCRKGCYALKAWKQYGNVRTCWTSNLDAYRENAARYFMTVLAEIAARPKIKLVRWHVGGDIPDTTYLKHIVDTAELLPSRRFLVFTKRYGWVAELEELPANLTIVLSAWPGYEIPTKASNKFPVAWVHDPENVDTRIPTTALACPGNCESCARCWNLVQGSSVVFEKH